MIVDKLAILLVATTGIILLGAVAIFIIESDHPDSQINTLLDALWWTVATVTTVGYGDILPVTDVGRIMGLFYMVFGISILGVLLSTLGPRFYRRRIEKDEQDFTIIQKKFFDRMETLEKNQEKLGNDVRELIDQLKQNS